MNILISILLSLILASYAYYKKSFTLFGSLLACIFSIIITFISGYIGFIILLITFFTTVIISKISKVKRNKIINDINQKHGRRDAIQVFSNVGLATISIIIYYFTKNNIYLITYACVMAASLADTIGSEIGVLSKSSSIDICTFKKITKGISGGISVLGIIFSFLGSLLIAVTYYFIAETSINILIFICLMGFLGSIIDSILGSLVQVKYFCKICNKYTERKEHCNKRTDYYKGIKIINNDIVNILNNLAVFIISIIILFN